MLNNKLDSNIGETKKFKTHSLVFRSEGNFIIAMVIVNSSIYSEMVISSRAAEFDRSLQNQNNQAMNRLLSCFGMQPNMEYLFKPTPIENERYLIYRFIKSIFQEKNDNLYTFEDDREFRKFCNEYGFEYSEQCWFNRVYIKDSYENAVRYLIQQSLIFQDLYFPEASSSRIIPSLHDVDIMQKRYHFKDDFMNLYSSISDNKIEKLYHFTDSTNVKSIIDNGYIFSNRELKNRGILPKYASSPESRSMDTSRGQDNYVRLCFVKNHPMMHTAMTCGRIGRPEILEINPLVLLLPNVLISDRNALKSGARIGGSANYLNNVRFNYFNKNYLEMDPEDRSFFQAEVLVPTKIGCEMILNIETIK